MQTISVAEKGISYLLYCLQEYAGGCVFFVMYAACILYVYLKGSELMKKVFLPQAFMLLATVFNPLFPMLLNKIFDVNNEYYRFLWIAPVVILSSIVLSGAVCKASGYMKSVLALFFTVIIIFGGQFLYKDGYILSPNIYKMPTEIPKIAQMMHEDAKGRYEGDYYPRGIFEFDYEMCMRQYDASIMLASTREDYLTAISGKLTPEDILSEDNYSYRLLSVVACSVLIEPDEFLRGMENTGTEYVCVSTANEKLCKYMENSCKLRLVGKTENHSLYHYELKEHEPFLLPDYSDVWENY